MDMDKDEYKELKTGTTPITFIHANNIFNKVMKELKALASDVDKYIIIKECKVYVSLDSDYDSDYDSDQDTDEDE